MSDVEPERPLSELHLWEIRGVRDILIVLVCALLFWLGYAMRDVTIPLLVALLLAYLFEPAIALIARTRWIPFGRIGAVSLLLTVISLIVLVAAALLVPRVVSQAVDLVGDVRSGLVRDRLSRFVTEYVPAEYRTDALILVGELPSGKGDESEAALIAVDYGENSSVPIVLPTATKSASANDTQPVKKQRPESPAASSSASDAVAAASSTSFDILGFAKSTGQLAWAVIADAIAISMLLFLIPFYFFFFSVSYPKVLAFFEDLLPDRSRSTINPLLRRMDGAVAGFVRGRIVIAIIMAVMYAVGWMIIGVPYSILLAIVVGAFSLVPFLGLVGVPVAIGMLALAELDLPEAQRMSWWGILLWPTLVFAIVNTLDGWVLTPIIAGKATNLDPVTILVAVLAGGSVLGAYGMLLAIPVAACLKILLSDLVIPKLKELGTRPATGNG
ncbi:MAG: AI-2E family transporter [Phycisphaerae bacterium]|jgi:predicted PurR-regulated permease PerM|nr:AI-2E family transporter [Phycisphaerae bacterium]